MAKQTLMQVSIRETVFDALAELYPDAQSELHYKDHFQLLIAVILSAQTTDVSVNKVTPGLFLDAPNAEAMVELGVEDITSHIRSLGLYRNKAKNVHACAERLVALHDGEVPSTRAELEALAGVGHKTASVVLNVAFGQPTIAVDTHVFRVSRRLGLVDGKTPVVVEKQLEKVVPKKHLQRAHHYLIFHGRRLCDARKPKCQECPVNTLCHYGKEVVLNKD